MKNFKYLLYKFLIIVFLVPIVVAEEDTKEFGKSVDLIVVTGSVIGVSSFEVPYTVKSLSENELSEKLVRSLPEALREIPGVLVQKTANGQGSPFIRGFTGYRTLALIDGIRYNNSVYRDGPNEYFSLIDFHTLESMELLLGPSSILYGSDAIGGSLNLRTKSSDYLSEKEGLYAHGSQAYRFSSAEDSHQSRTEFEVGQGALWGMHLGFTYKDFGDVNAAEIGEEKHTGYGEMSWDVRFDSKIDEKWKFTLAYQNLLQDDVWRTHSTIYGESLSGTTTGSDLRRLKDQQRDLTYVKFTGDSLQGMIARASVTFSLQDWNEEADRIKSSGKRILQGFDSSMYGIDMQLESDTEFASLIYGVDIYHDSVDTHRVDHNADGSVDKVRIQGPVGDDSSFLQAGVYLQGDFPLSDRVTLSSGVRYAYTKARIGRFEDPDTALAASFADSWESLVASLRLNYDLSSDGEWKLWSGLSQSFRAPNVADLSRFGTSRSDEIEIAATGLDPEYFLTYEIGLKAQTENYDLAATYYYTRIDDFITSTPTGNIVDGLTEVSKQNSSAGFVQGVELSARYYIDENWEAFANVGWLEGELDTFSSIGAADSGREPMSRIMPLTGGGGIRWHRSDDKLWFALSATVADRADELSSGDQGDVQRIPPGGTPGYALINFRGGYRIYDNMEINFGLENLLDEAYRSHGSGSNEPGIGLTVGFKVSF
ncbi:MAG: TonB-dependent receptor [Lentisphaeraceae bacterium]|nr:TonB-dependent receptor [Lentisphaeraceae bacterium]